MNKFPSISFDLDGLLICPGHPEETLSWWRGLLTRERLRLGCAKLFAWLNEHGHIASIYTSSLRSEGEIRRLFRAYGITLNRVVTGEQHQAFLSRGPGRWSKRPQDFGFDIHVDNEAICDREVPPSLQLIILPEKANDWDAYLIVKLSESSRVISRWIKEK